MRTTKFRGKRINRNGEWAYGDLRILPDRTLILPQKSYDAAIDRDAVDEKTIGQFTCLFDKNDKEIYEGDIVKYYTLETITNDLTQPIEHVIEERYGMITYDLSSFVIKDDDYDDVELKYYSKDYRVENPESIDAVNADKFPFITNENDLCNIEVIGNIHDNPELLKNND